MKLRVWSIPSQRLTLLLETTRATFRSHNVRFDNGALTRPETTFLSVFTENIVYACERITYGIHLPNLRVGRSRNVDDRDTSLTRLVFFGSP